MFLEVMSDTLNGLYEILVGGIGIQAKPTGNLAYGQVFVETEVEDAAVRFLHLLVHVSSDVVDSFQPFVNRLKVGFIFYGHQSLYSVVYPHLSDSVQTGIARGGQQITVILGWNVAVCYSQEDVLHHVLSFFVIAQQDSGQMNHLAVVLAEKLFDELLTLSQFQATLLGTR